MEPTPTRYAWPPNRIPMTFDGVLLEKFPTWLDEWLWIIHCRKILLQTSWMLGSLCAVNGRLVSRIFLSFVLINEKWRLCLPACVCYNVAFEDMICGPSSSTNLWISFCECYYTHATHVAIIPLHQCEMWMPSWSKLNRSHKCPKTVPVFFVKIDSPQNT